MDGSNPIVSGANILAGSGAITIPTQVHEVYSIPVEEDRALCCTCLKKKGLAANVENITQNSSLSIDSNRGGMEL